MKIIDNFNKVYRLEKAVFQISAPHVTIIANGIKTPTGVGALIARYKLIGSDKNNSDILLK